MAFSLSGNDYDSVVTIILRRLKERKFQLLMTCFREVTTGDLSQLSASRQDHSAKRYEANLLLHLVSKRIQTQKHNSRFHDNSI